MIGKSVNKGHPRDAPEERRDVEKPLFIFIIDLLGCCCVFPGAAAGWILLFGVGNRKLSVSGWVGRVPLFYLCSPIVCKIIYSIF
jgi:hypothetical protein